MKPLKALIGKDNIKNVTSLDDSKKFTLSDIYKYVTIDRRKIKVRRIIANKNFESEQGIMIKKGELGGWVEYEGNLSEYDKCWIFEESIVCDNGQVCDNATVCQDSIVCGNAVIIDNAVICRGSLIFGNAIIEDDAYIEHSKVGGKSRVGGSNHIVDTVINY